MIRRLAWKRFILGYPPRKISDTSTGDAINWEWIIDCVQRTNRDPVIVSRDSDFGCVVGSNACPNDWLAKELKERTKLTRKLTLTSRLSDALDRLNLKVTKKEKREETLTIQEDQWTDVDKSATWRAYSMWKEFAQATGFVPKDDSGKKEERGADKVS